MLWLGAFVGVVALLMLWALAIAPGRARELFASLQAQGWSKVPAEDEAVRSALDVLQPFELSAYGVRRDPPPRATVVDALARSGPGGMRYLLQLRVAAGPVVDSFGTSITLSTVASTVALEERPLHSPLVYVLASDSERRYRRSFEVHGLRPAASGLFAHFGTTFIVLHQYGADPSRLPEALHQALLESADLFVFGAGARGRFLPDVCLRLSAAGWALMVPEAIVTDSQMRAFVETADRISRSLSAVAEGSRA
jgi:hypothetical protein